MRLILLGRFYRTCRSAWPDAAQLPECEVAVLLQCTAAALLPTVERTQPISALDP